MVYRHTEKTQARKVAAKKSLLDAGMQLVAGGGFGALTITAVAQLAGMSTGAVYKHFESKAELCAELFRVATERELAMVRAAATGDTAPAVRLLDAIETFALRALQGRRLAYALIAEPVDALVDAERLRYRLAYARIFEALIDEGISQGTFAPQISAVSAAALVGVISESLVGPLSWQTKTSKRIDQAALLMAIQNFCLNAVAPTPRKKPVPSR